MFEEKRKPMTRSMKIGILGLALLAVIVGLSSCNNPIVQAVDDLRTDAVSPRIVLSLADNSSLASGGTASFGQISSGTSAELVVSIANDGKSSLAVDVAGITLVPANGTEAGCFVISATPEATIASGASSTLSITLNPSSAGVKSALVTLPTNDTRSPVVSFTVQGTGSSVLLSTAAVSSLTTTTTSAYLGGDIKDDGGNAITARGICWGTSPSPTTAANSLSDGESTGIYSVFVSGLSAGTLYYVRAWAVNSAGTTYGRQVSFWTLPPQPSAPGAVPVGGPDGSGKLAVSWTPTKGASAYDLHYNSSNDFSSSQTVSTSVPSATVTGLPDFTTHYLWVVARNASGSSATSPSGTGIPGVRVSGIGLDRSSASLSIGSTLQLNATISPADATQPAVSWTSGSDSIASVSDGVVTAMGPGSTVITATSTATAAGNMSKTATCTVNVPPQAPELESAVTAFGGEVSLSWTAPAGATSYNIYYSKVSGTGTAGTKISGITGTSTTVSGLTNWKDYYFVVTAVCAGGESVASNQFGCIPIRQEIIVVNNGSDSTDFNLFNATSGSVKRPTTGYILGPNALATDGAASVAIDPNARNALYLAYTGTGVAINPGFATYSYNESGGYATSPYTDHHCDGFGSEHLVVVTTSSGKKCLYVAYNAQAYIVMYDIDGNGNLSGIHTYSNARTDSARYLSADPSGRFLFASNYDASRITAYAIDSTTGHLSEVGYYSSGLSNPYRSVVTPDGAYLLVTNYGNGTVACFAINSSSGALTYASSVCPSESTNGPTGIVIDSTGTNVYVCSVKNRGGIANLGLGYLNHLTLSGGILSKAADWSNTLYGPTDLALDATGTRLIVLDLASTSGASDGGALVYQLNSDGSVVPKSGVSLAVSFGTGAGPTHLVVVKLP